MSLSNDDKKRINMMNRVKSENRRGDPDVIKKKIKEQIKRVKNLKAMRAAKKQK